MFREMVLYEIFVDNWTWKGLVIKDEKQVEDYRKKYPEISVWTLDELIEIQWPESDGDV